MLAGMSLLLVEDDEDTRELLASALRARHAEVRTAANGTAAIAMTESWCPDVLLIDLVLPDLDGRALLASIRGGASPCNAPAIAISGKASANELAASLAAGFSKHLSKPARISDIVSVVRELRGLGHG